MDISKQLQKIDLLKTLIETTQTIQETEKNNPTWYFTLQFYQNKMKTAILELSLMKYSDIENKIELLFQN